MQEGHYLWLFQRQGWFQNGVYSIASCLLIRYYQNISQLTKFYSKTYYACFLLSWGGRLGQWFPLPVSLAPFTSFIGVNTRKWDSLWKSGTFSQNTLNLRQRPKITEFVAICEVITSAPGHKKCTWPSKSGKVFFGASKSGIVDRYGHFTPWWMSTRTCT